MCWYDDAHQSVGRDAAPTAPMWQFESASGDSHVGRQPEACGPFGRQLADGFVGRLGLIEQTGAEARKQRVECREELLRGESSPLLVPHGLVPGMRSGCGRCRPTR